MQAPLINPLVPQADHVAAWIDRMGCMEFIGDQALEGGKANPAYSNAAHADHDNSYGRHEYSLWWL